MKEVKVSTTKYQSRDGEIFDNEKDALKKDYLLLNFKEVFVITDRANQILSVDGVFLFNKSDYFKFNAMSIFSSHLKALEAIEKLQKENVEQFYVNSIFIEESFDEEKLKILEKEAIEKLANERAKEEVLKYKALCEQDKKLTRLKYKKFKNGFLVKLLKKCFRL